ncbi:hypothetical protein G4Y79_23275 [Phototrophicus methaneseepsis]|uniref:Uncharacterized protein n=2 Tax=Phototrophicus methaneseepsis TaxID=2710758 RepID=A0A7S8IEL4_9CHLR|nr:hypothetical protein G4Y79_23275 [Phototrophicus methaneseepsis]
MPNFWSIVGFFAFLALVLIATLMLLRLRQSPADFMPLTPIKPLITAYETPFWGQIPAETAYLTAFRQPGVHIRGNPTLAPPTKISQESVPIEDDSTAALLAPAPICYTSANSTLMCLGRVFNMGDVPLSDVRLHVSLLEDRNLLAEQTVISEQPIVMPGAFAPYRALFKDAPLGYDEIQAQVLRATLEASLRPELSVRDESATYIQGASDIGRYEIQATIVNPHAEPAENVRVTVTVLNDDDEIVGYRVLALSAPIVPNGIYPFMMDIIPLTTDTDLHYTLTVTAR